MGRPRGLSVHAVLAVGELAALADVAVLAELEPRDG
jgi:hypothetical protein